MDEKSYPLQSRVIIEWKCKADKSGIPQQLAELVGANIRSKHPVLSVLTDLHSFFNLQIICKGGLYEWMPESNEFSLAMIAIAHWLNNVCSSDPSFNYKNINLAQLKDDLKKEVFTSFTNLKGIIDPQFDDSGFCEQMAVADYMSPIDALRYTVDQLRPRIADHFSSMYS